MKPLYKGLLLGAVHLALVLSLGGKLLYDRATRPRIWVRAAPFDPDLPIRGRYVRLRLELPARGFSLLEEKGPYQQAILQLEAEQLTAVATEPGKGVLVQLRKLNSELLAVVLEPVAFFIPEHVPDPSRRAAGEEVWVEVTVPKKGAPRPVRLGVKKDQVLTPLKLE